MKLFHRLAACGVERAYVGYVACYFLIMWLRYLAVCMIIMRINDKKYGEMFVGKENLPNFAITMTESMTEKLRILALLVLLLGAPVLGVMAQGDGEELETELQSVTLSVNGEKVYVSGAEGMVLEIYNLTGVKVATYRIDSDSKQLSLGNLQKGYYILKVGNVVRKVSIR